MTQRNYSATDQFCLHLDQVMRTVFGKAATTDRLYPAAKTKETELTEKQRQHSASLMRVNHAGEVCAQALYHGQGLVSRREEVKEKMQHAMIEEGDHLSWCQTRLQELGSHVSYLNPFWYVGSFAIGVTAGLVGDKWSLGFLAETENQVVKHLQHHLTLLPSQDEKSYQILTQMQQDEAQHREDAIHAGAAELPWVIKKLMQACSKMMVKVAYFI
jgi:ubiquinone biosynthesis monooxygenase Coq7